MKIAFDLRRMGNPGIGRYMKCLVEEILNQEPGHDYLLILAPETSAVIRANSANVTRVAANSQYYSLREQIELPRILRKHRVGLLHSPHFLIPLSHPCPTVVTIHDVIYLACPEDRPSRLGALYYRAMVRAATRLATRIITDSNFSKAEIVRYLGVDPANIAVTYPGFDSCFGRVSDLTVLEAVFSKYGIDRDYILYTGIYKRRKNHAGLFRSFKHFLAAGANAQLVIAGPLDKGVRRLRRLAKELDVSNRVIFTGWIGDSELCALYSAARVYACPSLYEGFGFTILEAMACGAPVVCSDAASLPEVAGDAALYANANDAEAFAEALYATFNNSDLRREMIERGTKNLRRFSWSQTAGRCLETYEEAVGNPSRPPVAAV